MNLAPKAEEFTTAEMAEDPRYRSSDPFAKPQGGASGGDPLAELARLIGQNDPFAELNQRNAPPRQEQRAPNAAPSVDWRSSPLPDPFRSQPSAPPAYTDPFAAHGSAHAPAQHPSAQRAPQQPTSFPSFITQGAPQPREPHVNGQPYAGAPSGYPAAQSDPYQQQPAYDPAAYAEPPQGYETDPYYGEEQPQDGMYPSYEEAAAPRRRGGILTVLAVLALAIVGTAGAFGYRAVFGNNAGSVGGAPPVIRADGTPTKIVPAATSGEQQSNNKLIYDRVGDRNQGEKVVTREEQPVQIREPVPPRAIFPGPSQANAAMPPNASALAPVASVPPGVAEPKKVKTVTIRSDGSLPPGAPSVTVPPIARNAAPQVAMTEPPPAPRAVRTQPIQQQPVQSGNAPLSLQAPSGAAPAQVAPPAPRVASAPAPRASAAPAASGSYVQVSSQRSEAEAQNSFRSLQARYPNILGGQQAVVRRADLADKGTYYRAQVGPFSPEQAAQVCDSLKAAGGQCVVQRN